MPIAQYFGGHGEAVLSHMKKTYGEKKAESVFYATKNKLKSNLPNGVALTPKGDIGQHRGVEAKIAGAFKGTKIMSASKAFRGN